MFEVIPVIDDEYTTGPDSPRQRPWYILDIVLLVGLVLAYVDLFGVLHILSYILGLQREPSLVFAGVLLALGVLTMVLLSVLAGRMVRTWRRCIPNRRRRWRLRLPAVTGVIIFLVLPFTPFGFPRYKTYAAGFRRYVKAHVDLSAMRAWLSTRDPNRCSDYVYDLTSGCSIEQWWPDAAPWAKTITPLDPHSAMLLLDGDGHPMIGIRWHGLFNWWGLVVGSEQMGMPPAGFERDNEYRLPLGSGAYVWYRVN